MRPVAQHSGESHALVRRGVELDKHEVTNAIDNAIKELDRRYDLRGKGSFEQKDLTVQLTAEPSSNWSRCSRSSS